MDIKCSKCGEPWDTDCLHEEVEFRREESLALANQPYENVYNGVRSEFYARGCKALTSFGSACYGTDPENGAAISALQDMLGDDIDGLASTIEDFGL